MKKRIILTAAALMVGMVFGMTYPRGIQTGPPKDRESVVQGHEDIFGEFPGMDRAYTGPLPWADDPAFLAAVRDNRTQVLMAAYRASLPDPIGAEGYNIALAARQLAGTVVQPEEVFSQNQTLGPYTENRGYRAGPTYSGNQLITTVGGGVCKIASMLYNVVTFSDLPVVMRYAHSMTVPYVPPGQDATVYFGAKDFRFLNNTGAPVLIWAEKVEDTLFMALYGSRSSPEVVWFHEVFNRVPPAMLDRPGQNLSPGDERVISEGKDGLAVRSWVTVKQANGDVTVKKKGTSYYSPIPWIIEYGPAPR